MSQGADLPSKEEIRIQLANLKKPEEPILKRYKTNDSTVPKLQELLSQNPHGLLVVRDEIVGLFAQLDQEQAQSDRAFYLEGWNGDTKLTFDRIGRGSIFATVCLSVFGGIQPDPLKAYLYEAMRSGANDGLVQRLQMVTYPNDLEFQYVDVPPNELSQKHAFELLQKIAEIDFVQYGAIQDVADESPYFRFSTEAQEFFKQWLIALEAKLESMRKNDEEPVLIEHLSKYRSLMPTLALITHVVEMVDKKQAGPVSLEAAQKAGKWCDFLEAHARRIYGMVGCARESYVTLAKKIRGGQLGMEFSCRDVYTKHWKGLSKPEEAQEAINKLVVRKWLRLVEGLNVVRYAVNPKISSSI